MIRPHLSSSILLQPLMRTNEQVYQSEFSILLHLPAHYKNDPTALNEQLKSLGQRVPWVELPTFSG